MVSPALRRILMDVGAVWGGQGLLGVVNGSMRHIVLILKTGHS